MKIFSDTRFYFNNIILKRWLLKVGPVKRKTILTKIKEDLLQRGLSSSVARKGFLQLFCHPVIQMRRKTARQIARNDHVKYEKQHNEVISKEEIYQLHDANNNVENVVSPDYNYNETASMGPSNSRVESAIGFGNQSAAGSCSEILSKPVKTKTGEESKASDKNNSDGLKDDEKKYRDSEKRSRNREKKKDSKKGNRRSRSKSQGKNSEACKLKQGENPNGIPWRLIEIDPESLPKPCSSRTKLNWMRDERRRKRDRLFAKIIEIFGEDSDEDIGYQRLLSKARIPIRKRRTIDSDTSTEKSNVTPDEDTEFNEQTADQRSPIFLSRKLKKKRKRNVSEETVVFPKKKSSKRYSTPSYVPSAASTNQTRENWDDSTPPTSDIPTDSDDPNYRPSHSLAGIPSTSRDPSSRRTFHRSQKIDKNESSATITSSNLHDPEKNPSKDEASLESTSTIELLDGKEVDKNKRNSGLTSFADHLIARLYRSPSTPSHSRFNSDLSFTAAESNIKSVAASRGRSVIRNKSQAIHLRKKISDCIKDAENEESAINDDQTTEQVSTESSLGDPLFNCIDSKVEKISSISSKSSPLRSQKISEGIVNPSSTTEMESNDRLLGALDKIFLYLLNRRRFKEREKSASKLAIQRNRQEELLKVKQEFESELKLFRQEFFFLMKNLSTFEQVLCFISQGLENRTPNGIKRFTQAEVHLAMQEAGVEDKSGGVKVEPSGNEENVCSVERTILTIDLTHEESVKQDICDSSTDPPVQQQKDEVKVFTKIEPNEANKDCSTSKEPAEFMHDLNANEIPLTVPSIAKVMTISRQLFETIDEKRFLLPQEEDPCLMCSLASRVACKRCLKANYCSKKCQESHWEQYHHVTCVPRQEPISE